MTYIYISSSSSSSTVRFLSDGTTTLQILEDIKAVCSGRIKSSSQPIPYMGLQKSEWPQPEQVIQYYRASTAVLTLDGYNNSVALIANSSDNAPLPSTMDQEFVSCVNSTIGTNISLSDGAERFGPSSMMLVWLVLIIGYLL